MYLHVKIFRPPLYIACMDHQKLQLESSVQKTTIPKIAKIIFFLLIVIWYIPCQIWNQNVFEVQKLNALLQVYCNTIFQLWPSHGIRKRNKYQSILLCCFLVYSFSCLCIIEIFKILWRSRKFSTWTSLRSIFRSFTFY